MNMDKSSVFSYFSTLPLHKKEQFYRKYIDSSVNRSYEFYVESMVDEFFRMLDDEVKDKYGRVLFTMGLDTAWDAKLDQFLNTEEATYEIIYYRDEEWDDSEEYETLIKFSFTIDELSEYCVDYIFEEISDWLEECFEDTAKQWSKAMIEYYQYVSEHCSDFVAGKCCDSLLDYPQKYFSAHETVVLD